MGNVLKVILLILISTASFGQVIQERNASGADRRIILKNGFRLPQVCNVSGNPDLLNYSAFDSKGAMVFDTCAGKIKRWSGSAWVAVADSGASGGGGSTEYVVSGLGVRVDSSGRVYTVNSDTASSVVLSRQRAAATYALIGAGGGVTTMANIGAVPNAQGATISGSTLTLQPANASFGGVVTTAAQTFAGNKTFNGIINSGTGTGARQYLYDGGATVRFGSGINSAELQSFVPAASRFTWNGGGDMNATGVNEWMRLNSAGLTLTVPFLPSTLGSFGQGTGTGFKINYFVGGAGSNYGVGINSLELQSYVPATARFTWNGGGTMNTTGTNEWMRLTSAGLVIGATSLTTSARLEVAGTTGAILFPRLTTAQRDALTPTDGMVIYNTTTSKFQGRAGGAWVDLH